MDWTDKIVLSKAKPETKLAQARAEVLKEVGEAIDNEPEFPGEMPAELWEAIQEKITEGGLRNLIQVIMRNTVRLTKDGIRKRLALKSGKEVKY